MARKNVKTMFGSLIFALIVVIAAIFGGFYYLIHIVATHYKDPNLEIVREKTASEEGFCLTDVIQETNLTFYSLGEFYTEACVSIIVEVEHVGAWLGSGVCVASKGYEYAENKTLDSGSFIVTNYHVISEIYEQNATRYTINVYPNEYQNEERYGETLPYEGTVLWFDTYLDSAIIYVKENIDWVRMKDRSIDCDAEEALKDEPAFAIGSPEKLENQNTVTRGSIVSSELNYSYTVTTEETAFFEENEILSNVYEYLIPIQIHIQGGNSGGGLFDREGYLIGQPTLGTSSEDGAVNYAIPIYPVTLVLDDIIYTIEVENSSLKLYSLDYLDIETIDYYESDVMQTCFTGQVKYYYGKNYLSSELIYKSDTGLKVLDGNELFGFEKGDVISSVKISGKTSEITCRNDLIFSILKCRKGDVIQFNIKDKPEVLVELA